MYRLLIVDDEPMIVDGLYQLFINHTGLELDVFRAYNGTEALNCMKKVKVDIVLSDIRMPGMDGFRLLDAIRSNWPDCRVIFLTGYEEFEYVYTAIQQKDVGYLLKTEGDEQIILAVEKAVGELDANLRSREFISKIKANIDKALPVLQKELILDIVESEAFKHEIMEQQFRELEMPLDCTRPVILMLGRIDQTQGCDYAAGRIQRQLAVNTCFREWADKLFSVFYFSYGKDIMVWLMQPSSHENMQNRNDDWEWELLYVRELLQSVQTSCIETINISVSFILSSEPIFWTLVGEQISCLKSQLNYYTSLGKEMILTDKRFKAENNIPVSGNYPVNLPVMPQNISNMALLETYLESGRSMEFFNLLHELTQSFTDSANMHYTPSLELYFSIALVFLSYINKWDYTEKLSFRVDLSGLTRIEEHSSWNSSVEYLEKLAGEIFLLQGDEHNFRSQETIQTVKKYVEENLSGDISLTMLAETVYHNPSYLSRLFKQETGINISEYILGIRMERAKSLLKKSDFKIHEVGAAVGFESAAYFTRFFKKITGHTPQEFRDGLTRR